MTTTTPRHVPNWIDGGPSPMEAALTHSALDPATGELVARVDLAGPIQVERAIGSADEAARIWRDSSLAQRTRVLFAFREQLRARTDELARIITEEHGKLLSDARGEGTRGMEVVAVACGITQLLKGGYSVGGCG